MKNSIESMRAHHLDERFVLISEYQHKLLVSSDDRGINGFIHMKIIDDLIEEKNGRKGHELVMSRTE